MLLIYDVKTLSHTKTSSMTGHECARSLFWFLSAHLHSGGAQSCEFSKWRPAPNQSWNRRNGPDLFPGSPSSASFMSPCFMEWMIPPMPLPSFSISLSSVIFSVWVFWAEVLEFKLQIFLQTPEHLVLLILSPPLLEAVNMKGDLLVSPVWSLCLSLLRFLFWCVQSESLTSRVRACHFKRTSKSAVCFMLWFMADPWCSPLWTVFLSAASWTGLTRSGADGIKGDGTEGDGQRECVCRVWGSGRSVSQSVGRCVVAERGGSCRHDDSSPLSLSSAGVLHLGGQLQEDESDGLKEAERGLLCGGRKLYRIKRGKNQDTKE